MPSRYSSSGTRDDAKVLAENLGVELLRDPDRQGDGGLRRAAGAESFEGREPDITEENLQARIRGNLLMALSNKFGWLVLTTGNKSENSVGYSTLYGDSAGGFAVIKDVPKTLVYRLSTAATRAARRHPVPRSIIDRPPSAELREDQRDADSLPRLRHARRDPRGVRRGGPRSRAARARRAAGATRSRRWSRWSTGPSTSAARRRPGSRSRRARSGATGGCRSPTPTGRGGRGTLAQRARFPCGCSPRGRNPRSSRDSRF